MDYLRVETLHPALVLKDARQWPMKLQWTTAKGLRRSRCGEIGSPIG